MGREELQFPPGRYGHRRAARRPNRLLFAMLVALVVAGGLAITFRLYDTYGDNKVHARVVAFTVVSDTGVRVQFELSKKSGSATTCVVRARSRDGAEVGRALVRVPADSPATVVYTLTTSRKAVTGEVLRCLLSSAAP